MEQTGFLRFLKWQSPFNSPGPVRAGLAITIEGERFSTTVKTCVASVKEYEALTNPATRGVKEQPYGMAQK